MCIRDSTWGAQLYGDIGKWYEARKKEDNVIYIPKTEYDAFYKTDLAAVLIQNEMCIRDRYTPSRRTNEWIKIKNMPDDDFVVCGYIRKNNGLISLVLGQYINSYLTFMAHVSIGISNEAFRLIERLPVSDKCPFTVLPRGHENAVWLKKMPVCKVSFMQRTASGKLRQPVFRGLRDDKFAEDCVFRG